MLIQRLDYQATMDQRYFVISARRKGTKLINVQINIMATVNILVIEEAINEEESAMVSAVTAENEATRILIVGETHRMRAKVHNGTNNMEVTVSRPDWQALTTFI